jgi:hypothetical protein
VMEAADIDEALARKRKTAVAGNRRGAINLGVRGIWMVGEIEEADRTYRPSGPTL